jgi:uncharacterized membrane protein
MAYDPNQQYQQPPQYPPPGPQNYPQSGPGGYPPPGYGQPPVVQKSLIAQQLGPSSIGIDANIAGALSYFPIIGLIFFLIEKQNKFVRFHAFQGMAAGFAVWIVNIVVGLIGGYIFYGFGLLADLFWLLWVIGGIYAAVQAYNGKWFQLPVVGSMAYNNAMAWNPGMPGPMAGPPPNTMYPPQGGYPQQPGQYPPPTPGNYPQSGPGYPPQQPPQWPQQ